MKTKTILQSLFAAGTAMVLCQCEKPSSSSASGESDEPESPIAGQSAVADDVSQKDIVKVAVGSPDHTTLVTAVKAAELVDVLSNAGPFTVFAPTNAAFDKLPAGTVENLLKPENKDELSDILQYHVAIGGYQTRQAERRPDAQHGQQRQRQGLHREDGKVMLNGSATVIGTVQASNGIVHVVDGVILPPAK